MPFFRLSFDELYHLIVSVIILLVANAVPAIMIVYNILPNWHVGYSRSKCDFSFKTPNLIGDIFLATILSFSLIV